MADDPDDLAEEPVETAQEPVEPTTAEPEAEAHPWGEDFDPERAWNTIQNLRQFEKQAKEYERLRSDPDAIYELARQAGLVEEAEDPEPEPETQPTAQADPWLDTFRTQWVLKHAAEQRDEIVAELGRDLTEEEIGLLLAAAPVDEVGVPQLKAAWDAMRQLSGPKEPRKPARPPGKGSPGVEKFDIHDEEQRLKRMAAVMEAQLSES